MFLKYCPNRRTTTFNCLLFHGHKIHQNLQTVGAVSHHLPLPPSGGGRDGARGSRHGGSGKMLQLNAPLRDGMRPLVAPHSRARQPVAGREQLPPVAPCRRRMRHSSHPRFPQHLSRIRPLHLGDLLGRAFRHDFTAAVAAFGTEIDDPIGITNHVEVVFDDQDRIPSFDQTIEHVQQSLNVGEVEAGGGFIEDVHGAAGGPFGEFA